MPLVTRQAVTGFFWVLPAMPLSDFTFKSRDAVTVEDQNKKGRGGGQVAGTEKGTDQSG